MATPVVAFDEAGNTGGNLLDPDQPVFVLASVHLDEEQAAEIARGPKTELKFSKLRKSPGGRDRIISLLNSPILVNDRVFVSTFHKPFMAITKLVDLLVEPLHKAGGIDLYERGANLGLSNLFHFTMPVFLGPERFASLREAFVEMVRFPSQATMVVFYGIIERAYEELEGKPFQLELGMLLATRPVAEAYLPDWDGSDLDPAIPAFFVHASTWTDRIQEPFAVIHDVSKPLAQEQLILEAMMSPNEIPRLVGYDRRKATFPLRASGIEFKDSTAFPAIQVADVIASSAAHCMRAAVRGEADEFCEALLQTRVLSGHHHPVWPELKVTPEALGTEEPTELDANQYIGEYVARRLGGIPPKGQRRKK